MKWHRLRQPMCLVQKMLLDAKGFLEMSVCYNLKGHAVEYIDYRQLVRRKTFNLSVQK